MLITNKHYRQNLKNKKRIVIKVGSSSLVHPETGETDLLKLEQLVRVLCDLRNQGKDVVLVSSGAIGVGRKALGLNERPKELAQKQACASVGQGMLMMIYQKLFNGIQPCGFPDSYDETYYCQRKEPAQCQKYIQ